MPEQLNEFRYKLIIKGWDKPNEDQLMDFVTELHDLLDCYSIELEGFEE